MSLRERTDIWTKWILKETDTDTYTKVVHEIFERLWLCVERFDESNNNHEYVILANLFGEEIYTDPWSVYSQMCNSILQELHYKHNLFDTFKLVYVLFRLDYNESLPESDSVKYVNLIISEACDFDNDIKTFEAFKMLKDTYL